MLKTREAIRANLPGTVAELVAATGLARGAISSEIRKMRIAREIHEAHLTRRHRVGSWAVVWAAGGMPRQGKVSVFDLMEMR